ncbi:MAG: biopolymer transporter ExbD [Erythrobacter sp.]
MKAASAGVREPRRRKRRGFKRYDHGEPIKTIDTRPMAFVFGFIVLMLLLVQELPKHALVIDLPQSLPSPPIDLGGTEPPPIYYITIDAGGSIYVNDEQTPLKELPAKLRTENTETSEPLVRLTPSANTPYDVTLKVLGELDRLGLTSSGHFCFGDNWKHRTFETGSAGLQIFSVIISEQGPELDQQLDVDALPDPYFFEVCPEFAPIH